MPYCRYRNVCKMISVDLILVEASWSIKILIKGKKISSLILLVCHQKRFDAFKKRYFSYLLYLIRGVKSDNLFFRTSFVAYIRLQDAWVTGCLSLASDPESSVQIKLAQCVFDLIISPSLSWSKGSANGDSDSVEKGLGWVLCCKISSAGKVERSDVQSGLWGAKCNDDW